MFARLLTTSFLLFTVALLTGCSSSDSTEAQSSAQANSAGVSPMAQAAPMLRARDIDGQVRTFSEWIGKRPVIINVWGTWCPPCRREIPDMVKLYNQYKGQGVEIVSMAVGRDTPESVRTFTKNAGMDWVMVMRSDDVLRQIGYSGSVPTTVFLDKDGYEVQRFVGARSGEDFKQAFEALVSSS